MISDQQLNQVFKELRSKCGGARTDYFGLLYLEQEHKVPRERAINQIAFGDSDCGIDGFHFNDAQRNLYIFQFNYSESYGQFKKPLQRLIADGIERVFVAPAPGAAKSPIIAQLRSCLIENRALIDQVCFRFVFTGDPAKAERSAVLDKLREDLENKKYLIDQFFGGRQVGLVVEFRSASGRVGAVTNPRQTLTFDVPLSDSILAYGPAGEEMHMGLIRLVDLHQMYAELGSRFFDSNIRYGLGENKAVNRAILSALKQIVIDRTDEPISFAFNHNGITLFAEQVERLDGKVRLTAPRLLNGVQTVMTVAGFLESSEKNPKLSDGKKVLDAVRVPCKIITKADQKFVTRVTINNNRQNPVEPWNLHANDLIQLELQDKFRTELGIYYERQENAFSQLSEEDLGDFGIKEETKAIQMLKLTQTFLLTDGYISRLAEMRRMFEEDRLYEQIFRQGRLKANARQILLCYKVQFRLRKLAREIEQKGQNKYFFINRARYLLWALICQGLLNHEKLDEFALEYGSSMAIPTGYSEVLTWLATARVRLLLSDLMQDPMYAQQVQEGNLSFLRTDRAFDKCMESAKQKWGWTHKKLG